MTEITEVEQQQIERANASDRNPVVFVHGLCLLPSSWDRWRAMFEEAGYTTWPPPGPTTRRQSKRRTSTPRSSPTRRWAR
jgi:hypothetical protein